MEKQTIFFHLNLEITHNTLVILFCIPTIKRFWKSIHVCKFIWYLNNVFCCEMVQWYEQQIFWVECSIPLKLKTKFLCVTDYDKKLCLINANWFILLKESFNRKFPRPSFPSFFSPSKTSKKNSVIFKPNAR